MKISIKNFGPIDHFEFDLEKDLHVIYGENNIGKSWAIEVIYLVLKNYVKFIEADTLTTKTKIKSSYVNEVKEYIFNLERVEDINKIILNNYIKEKTKENLETFTDLMSSSLRNTFSIIKNPRYTSPPLIQINTKYFQCVFVIEKEKVKTLSFDLMSEIYFGLGNDDKFLYMIKEYLTEKKEHKKIESEYLEELKEDIENQIPFEIEFLGEIIFRRNLNIISNVYFLPSSREGLHHQFSNFGHILAELSRFRFQLKSQFKIPKVSEPIADYLQNLSEVSEKKVNFSLSHISNIIEGKIIGARIKFDESKTEIKFIDDRTKYTLDILEASSMIAEIAPLVIFIRYIIEVNATLKNKIDNILFIEEPEAHLHPKVQVEMMKIYVDLAKSGVKVVMTTHSDFMMNELSNLLLAKEIDTEKVGSYHLVMDEKRGSYDAGDMKATREGIEDYNFTDVAIQQYERRIEILEKLNQDALRQD